MSFLITALFYCVSIGTESLISAALLPILSSRIPRADYGVWILFVALFSFMRPLIALMMHDVIRMDFFNFSKERLQMHLQLSVLVPTIVLLLSLGLWHAQPELVSRWLAFPAERFPLVLVTAYLHGLLCVFLTVLQFRERKELYLVVQVLQAAVAIGATMLLLRRGYSWEGAALARIFALGLVVGAGYVWMSKAEGGIFSGLPAGEEIRRTVSSGARLIPSGLAALLVPLTDRLLVTKYLGPENTAYLGIGALFGTVVIIGSQGFITALQPSLFLAASRNDGAPPRVREESWFKLGLPIWGVVVIAASFIAAPFLVHYDLEPVRPYIIGMVVAFVAQAYFDLGSTKLLVRKKAAVLAGISVAVIVVNALLNLLFIERFGGLGSPAATALAYLLAALGIEVYMRRNVCTA